MEDFFDLHGGKVLTVLTLVMAVALVAVFGYRFWEDNAQLKEEAAYETISTTTPSGTTTQKMSSTKTTVAAKPQDIALLKKIKFNYISYSAINGRALSINTAELYEWCAKNKFVSIKGDVQITADGELVMCHDEGFTLNGNGRITLYDKNDATPIREMTVAECKALKHPSGASVCTFEEYIKICKKYDKIAYITIRDKYMEELVPRMMEILNDHKMVDKCIVNSFTYESLQAVRKAHATIVLSHVQPHNEKVTKEMVDQAVSLGNCLVCGFNFGGGSKVEDVKEIVDPAVMDYAKEWGVPIYEAQVHTVTIAKELEKMGITGVQILVAP